MPISPNLPLVFQLEPIYCLSVKTVLLVLLYGASVPMCINGSINATMANPLGQRMRALDTRFLQILVSNCQIDMTFNEMNSTNFITKSQILILTWPKKLILTIKLTLRLTLTLKISLILTRKLRRLFNDKMTSRQSDRWKQVFTIEYLPYIATSFLYSIYSLSMIGDNLAFSLANEWPPYGCPKIPNYFQQ